ncbi:LacI family DNA-binding transcriptional regulator [Xenorhabdus sp. XENO-10]|uniref:LacI family DNA-binding transcriptional regulator n=1 Tax=Xenorhabdus yunnanensis TaxID=3025878 RepID=A0ABT5LEW4_9GAMM|nr:LacI family DNA-binding transcriptional regulator [Xenorhabdus yunnanensis]MDC9589520.1 LacI family DNA-binding transcriptional regulator [Xenorhabdus yunnanensis]
MPVMTSESNKRVTIKSIAKEVGVSFSTVSKALNNDPAIKKSTRLLILNKANEMGYTPNSLAKGLRSHSTKTVAIIFSDIENPVLTYIFCKILTKMAEHGYTTMIFDSQFNENTERANILTVLSRQADFIILEPTSMNPDNLRLLSKTPNRLTLQGIRYETMNCHHVHVDYAHGGYLAACEMLSNGHKNCLVITEALSFPTSREFVFGIERAYNEYGVPFNRDMVKTTHSSITNGFQVIQQLWDHDKNAFSVPITGVLTFDDILAYGVYKAALQYNFKIPDDISVIGFDDNPISAFSMPPLTTIHLPKDKMAENHINILQSTLLSGRTETCFFSADPTLVVRGSVRNLLEKKRN